MRVTFFDPAEQSLSNFRKGDLFERLARRVVESSGYENVQLRKNRNSLEYDIEGRHTVSGTLLSGEAKALERRVDGQIAKAFVGGLLAIAVNERVDGLLISVSPPTRDAVDYLDSVANGIADMPLTLRVIAGDDLPTFVRDRRGYVSEDALRGRVREAFDLEAFDVWLVVTDRDEFFVATCGPTLIETPTHFALFNGNGTHLTLPGGVERLQLQLSDIAGLALAEPSAQRVLSPRAERLPTIDVGAGWFDYRFPAPPDRFIGRDAALTDVIGAVAEIRSGATSLRALQVLSRSGVGKSSLLLKLASELDNASSVTIDARSVRAPSEARLLVAALIEQANPDVGDRATDPPRTQDEAADALVAIGNALGLANRVGVIQLDQFESTLVRPAVFAAILDLLAATTTSGVPIIWIFARKNDLGTTYDESANVDLDWLNNQSKPIELTDFTPPESSALLDRLADELGSPVRAPLVEAITTFAAGFPWLLKRLCAHVISMRDEGVSQDELLQQGLRAEDLFEEDVAGLSEPDKALLRRLAASLPATGVELARNLEAEIHADRLTAKLNEFLGHKLLRLSGDVYDTYNDVFKTYLITGQVPFQSRYIFRISPKAALDLLPKIAQTGSTSTAAFQEHLGVSSRIALLNKLRELRMLGLISSERGRVALTPEAQSALESETLGDLLRTRLRVNALVSRILDVVATEDVVTMTDIAAELQSQLPHVNVEASTWRLYAQQLARWLDLAGLGYVEGESLRLRDFPTDDSLRGRDFYAARFVAHTFMPTVRPARVVDLLEALREGPMTREVVYARWGPQTAPGLLRDAETLDLIQVENGDVRASIQGRMLLARDAPIEPRDVAQLAIAKPNVRALIAALSDQPLDHAGQRQLVSSFGSANWTDGTWNWRLGILRAWLVATGQVRSRRTGLVARPSDHP